ncbi:MAG TPA: O-antigen ligase family protein [Longimicrobium sp.]
MSEYLIPKAAALNATAFACLLVGAWSARELRAGPADLFVLGSLLLTVLAALNSPAPATGLTASGIAVSFAVVFWSCRGAVRAGRGGLLLALAAAAVVLAAVVSLLDAYGAPGVAAIESRPGGTFGNRNRLAHILALGLPLLLVQALSAETRRRFTAYSVALVPVMAALALSRCRGAWLSTLVVVPLTLWLWRRGEAGPARAAAPRRLAILMALAAGSAAAAILLPNDLDWRGAHPYRHSLETLLDGRTGTGAGRLLQYRNTSRMIFDHPLLGVGPGQWTIRYPEYSPSGDPNFEHANLLPVTRLPQSDWFGLAAERGIPAALCWLLLLLAAVAPCAGLVKQEHAVPPERLRAVLLGGSVALGAIVMGTVDALVMTPGAAFWMALALGVCASTSGWSRAVHVPRAGRAACLVPLLLLTATIGTLSVGELAAVREYAGGGAEALERGLRINPRDYRARILLANELVATKRCDEAAAHIDAAEAWIPSASAIAKMRKKCASPWLQGRP